MFKLIKSLVRGVASTIKKAFLMVLDYGKEVLINSPAVAIMATSAMGITGIATRLGAESMFVPISYLNPTLTVYFLSVTTVLILATMAGKIADVRM